MMTNASANLQAIAQQFAILSTELRNNPDPETRRALLRKFRELLAEADKTIAEETPNAQE